MVSRQELKEDIKMYLERTGLFFHVRVKGRDLAKEGDELRIEYQPPTDSSDKRFWKAQGVLEDKLQTVSAEHFLYGISVRLEGPNQHGIYSAVLRHEPSVAITEDPTDFFLKFSAEALKDRYAF